MTIENFLLFATVCFIASMTPGPGILSVVTHSVFHGAKQAFPIMLGILSGLFLLSLMAIMGLGVVLEASARLFVWLQYLGSAYLCYTGIKLLGTRPHPPDSGRLKQERPGPLKGYIQGIAVSMVNPKAVGFFSALFIPFIDTGRDFFPQFVILESTLLGCSIFSLLFYSLGAQLISPVIRRHGTAFNRISGTCFIGFAAVLAGSTRKMSP